MSQPLFNHLSDIESLLRVSRQVLLFLDFDGTLAPIVEIPDQAVMLSETRSILYRLSQSGWCLVAIVSGRALSDIRDRVGLAGLTYAGNHGLEICGDGLHFVEPEAVQRIKMLGEISRRIRERLRRSPCSGHTADCNKGPRRLIHGTSVNRTDVPFLSVRVPEAAETGKTLPLRKQESPVLYKAGPFLFRGIA